MSYHVSSCHFSWFPVLDRRTRLGNKIDATNQKRDWLRDHSLFIPGRGLARIRGWGGSRQFRDSPRGVMRKLAYKRGGGGAVAFYNFVLFQRNVFIVVGSIKWYMISSF